MSDLRSQDDNWAELYRELGVEENDAPRGELSAHEGQPADEEEPLELLPAEDDSASPESEEGDEGEEGEESVEAGVGGSASEPGQKKRRRRRRRRRKKGAPEGDSAEATPGEVSATGEEASEEGAFAEESEQGEEEPTAIVGLEDSTPEMTRDILANWNVPSWEEIVAGLYRPDR